MIEVNAVAKTFRVHKKEPGLKASIGALFRRSWVEKQALVDVSLRVESGEIVGLLGANGAGKTTLVKILSGIIHPSAGSVRVLGFDPWERRNEFRRQVSLIMGQKAALWWDLPAADCFLLLREMYRIPPLQFKQNLDFLAETLRVKDQLTVQIRRLSLGERMKMELIAALLHNPRVVFFDEPTIGLDLTAQRAIRAFILQYRRQHAPAMLLTSHYMEDIEQLCERIVILRQGRVVYEGSLERVVRDYAQYKVISAVLDERSAGVLFELPTGLGDVLERTAERIRLKVPRAQLAASAGYLLQTLAVCDLTIEEEEIGTVIEALLRG
jgi:ABC-2 type transport system ATP-binding protein